MFGKSGQGGQPGQGGREIGRSVIAADVRIEGALHTDGVLEFDGRIDGDLSAHALGVGRSAVVRGNVAGEFVTIDGTVEGDVAAETLTLKPTAMVRGVLAYGSVTVESGAQVEGRFQRLAPRAAPAPAPSGPSARVPAGEAAAAGPVGE
ncbi:MAG: bactofilin family protein [Alkalilacustris sp.]